MNKARKMRKLIYTAFSLLALVVFMLCVSLGSVSIPVKESVDVIIRTLLRMQVPEGLAASIIIPVRIPRVITVALTGAALSLSGAAMQGLLKNPLADGSTLGVSAGASLGAVLAISLGFTIPSFQGGGTMIMSITFAFASLVLILFLAYRLDYSLSTNTIILIGVIFTMFAHSLISLLVVYASDKVKSIMFWTMGSLAGSTYLNALTMLITIVPCGLVIIRHANELNAFAIGEDNARHIGVNIKKVKLTILITVSVLIGVSVAIGGTIGFVGLVIPHITRMIAGPNHRHLLPASMLVGSIFLMLADLLSRTLLSPLELPIGVVTSFVGSVLFVYIFYSTRKIR